MFRPVEPDPSDCCGSGCQPCVWDLYYDRLSAFERHVADGGEVLEGSAEDAEEVPLATAAAKVPTTYSIVWRYAAHQGDDGDSVVDRDVNDAALVAKHAASARLVAVTADEVSPPVGMAVGPSSLRLIRLGLPDGVPLPATTHPGAAVSVFTPNGLHDAEWLCDRLGVTRVTVVDHGTGAEASLPARVELMTSPFAGPGEGIPPWLPAGVPIRASTLFTHFVDTQSAAWATPKFFRMLKDHTADAAQKEALGQLADLPWAEFRQRVISELPTLKSVLAQFPAANPPLSRLLEHSTPLRARVFSVAGASPDTVPAAGVMPEAASVAAAPATSLTLCVRPVVAESPRAFTGHVTGALLRRPEAAEMPLAVNRHRFWARPAPASVHVGMPGAATAGTGPTVIFAAGSGIAPFRRLLQQRSGLRAAALAGGTAAGWTAFPLSLLWVCRDQHDTTALAAPPLLSELSSLDVVLTRRTGPEAPALGHLECGQGAPHPHVHGDVASGLASTAARVWSALRPGAEGCVLWCGPKSFNDRVRGELPGLLDAGCRAASGGEPASVALRGLEPEEYVEALAAKGMADDGGAVPTPEASSCRRLWWEDWSALGPTEGGFM